MRYRKGKCSKEITIHYEPFVASTIASFITNIIEHIAIVDIRYTFI
jgi:hypothetical protein